MNNLLPTKAILIVVVCYFVSYGMSFLLQADFEPLFNAALIGAITRLSSK